MIPWNVTGKKGSISSKFCTTRSSETVKATFIASVCNKSAAHSPDGDKKTGFAAYLASFISICWRISWRSWSLLAGKMFLSSSSCLLGLFRSLTASSSFLSLRGRVPAVVQKAIERNTRLLVYHHLTRRVAKVKS